MNTESPNEPDHKTDPIPSDAGQSEPQNISGQPSAEGEVARLTAELAEARDKFLRAMAESDNIRRRADREKQDLIKYSLESVFKDFLPVLDTLERALPDDDNAGDRKNGGAKGPDSGYLEGMVMVKRQLLDVFKRHGLEGITSAGAPFDPNLHQAIQRVESGDVTTETVGSEFAKGYLLNGRLLRPAMVSVLVPGN